MSQKLEQVKVSSVEVKLLDTLLPKKSTRICCMCQNEFNNWRGDQICCSRKCSTERKSLKAKLKNREKPVVRFAPLEMTCLFPGCNNQLIRGKQATNKKFCDTCRPLSRRRVRMRSNAKRRADRMKARGKLFCQRCNDEITDSSRTKFCSTKCYETDCEIQQRERTIAYRGKVKRRRIEKKIQKHLDKVIELKRMIS